MFVKVIHKKWFYTMGIFLLILGVAALLLTFPRAAANGISRGLSVCSSVIIPALFPFLVLSSVIVNTGAAQSIGNHFGGVVRVLFGLPGCCAAGILLSFLGGYPAGAAVIAELIQSGQLSTSDAKRMLRFCVNAGPSFLISAIGVGLMNSATFGWLLLAAHFGASLLIGVLCAKRENVALTPHQTSRPLPLSIAFVKSVTTACQTMLIMCGFVLVFTSALALLEVVFTNTIVTDILACLLEVNCGCLAAAERTAFAPFLIGCTVGFGGICVHCQIAAQLYGTNTLSPTFFLERAAHALLTGLFTVLLLRLFPISLSVGSSLTAPLTIKASYDTATISVALLFLCGLWMLLLTKKNTNTIINSSGRKGVLL